ncbi:hypothetical protein CFOL_v3_03859, partial [Cephalotus follicularis]
MRYAIIILFPAILSFIFFLAQSTSHTIHNNNNNINNNNLNHELHEANFKIARLELFLEESIKNLSARSDYLKERETLIEEIIIKINNLQSALLSLQGDSLRVDERLNALEEEVRLLWAASRKNNFDIHILESKAQDAEDRLELVNSQVEKMADIVTEQWIQIQQFEQALLITEVLVLKAQRHVMSTRCPFLKFIDDLSGKHIPKVLEMLHLKLFGMESCLSSYLYQTQQQLKGFFSTVQKYHHKLQGFVRREMGRNEFTAHLANEELVFFVVCVHFVGNIFCLEVMEDTTWEQKLQALTHILTSPTTEPPLYSQLFISTQIPCYLNWDYPPVLCTKAINDTFLSLHMRWGFSLFIKRVFRFGLPVTSWRSKCPYQQPPPLILAKGLEEAQWGDVQRREYVRRRLRRKRLVSDVHPLIPIMVPNILLLSLLLWNPFPDLDS